MTTREQIDDALLATIQVAYQWGQAPQPKLVLWSKVDPALRPAAFLVKPKEQLDRSNPTLSKRQLEYQLYVYIAVDTNSDTDGGAKQFNSILDAIEAALAPSGPDVTKKRNTLGGVVWHCYISGAVSIDPGDLDGDGIAIIPINVLTAS